MFLFSQDQAEDLYLWGLKVSQLSLKEEAKETLQQRLKKNGFKSYGWQGGRPESARAQSWLQTLYSASLEMEHEAQKRPHGSRENIGLLHSSYWFEFLRSAFLKMWESKNEGAGFWEGYQTLEDWCYMALRLCKPPSSKLKMRADDPSGWFSIHSQVYDQDRNVTGKKMRLHFMRDGEMKFVVFDDDGPLMSSLTDPETFWECM